MNWFRQITFLLPFALFSCTATPDSLEVNADDGEVPPISLVEENCRKAEIIVRAVVLAQHTGDSASYSSATLRVEKTYRGSFQPADTLKYSFFKEPDEPALLGKKLIFFLKPYPTTNGILWVRASDLPIFSADKATEKLLSQTLKQD